MSWRDRDDFAKETGPTWRLLRGMVRKLVVTLSEGARWQFLGQRGGQGGDEVLEIEPFTGIGFYSRPPSDAKPEAIAVAVGGAKHLAVVALRDEATRRAVVGELAAGETAIFTKLAVVIIRDNGAVEIRSAGGHPEALAKQADLQALRDHVNGLPVGGTGSAPVPAPSVGTGTTVLLAE